ncbi:MAG: hypothetical protein HY304_08995 [candidate division Zixibacteria bacterium]|nr:hypothetical protein [candidate division Zixibacteria bacterium]
MRRILTGVAVVATLTAGNAVAGDYHRGATLFCQDCHILHGSQQHGYNANGGGNSTALGGAAPYDYLLRNDVNDLCLSCHDNQGFAPDVLGANGGTPPSTGRQAGALNMGNTSPYFDADGHTLGSTATAPGGTFSNPEGLECVDCHAQHGNGTPNPYRNLRRSGVTPISYAAGVNDITMDVFERSAAMGGDHYDITNVDFNEPSQTGSAYAAMCQGCHTNFHGNSSSANMRNQLGAAGTEWLRHPTADANIGALTGGHSSLTTFKNRLYRPKVMSAGDWGTQGVAWAAAPADLTPSCFSCHKGHGNQRAYGLIYPTGTAPIDEQGDGAAYKDLCKSCHVQG